MPVLQGYEAQTHQLPEDRCIDVLHRHDEPQHILWVPGPQLACLTGEGRRSDGRYSTSDIGRTMDIRFQRREKDPKRIYTRTRTNSITLFSVEGLIQKTCHTTKPKYVKFCQEFMEHVLPSFERFAEYHAELILFWYKALDSFRVVCHGPGEFGFKTATRERNERLAVWAKDVTTSLLMGTTDCAKVLVASKAPSDLDLVATPVCLDELKQNGLDILAAKVAELLAFHEVSDLWEPVEGQRDFTPVTPQLIWVHRDGSATLPNGTLIIKPQSVTETTTQAVPTAEDIRQALRAIIQQEMPAIIKPIVEQVIQARDDRGQLADLVKTMTGAVERLAELAIAGRDQTTLMQQMVDITLPSHQLFLPASDYIDADGVAEALKRAPKLTEPSLGLDHCPDHGKASLWMKRLCREENKKVAANAVARLMAKVKDEEEPALYIPEFRMKRLEREHVKVLMFNPACWAKLKQTFLPPDTPTILFPNLKTKEA